MKVFSRIVYSFFGIVAITVLSICLFGQHTASAKDADGNIVIVLDPGHGGHDGGACSVNGVNESVLNWNIAMALKAELETYSGIKVYLTKGSAEWFSNSGRGISGVNYGADMFISCHNNSSNSSDPRGVTVYSTVDSRYKDTMIDLSNRILEKVSACGIPNMGYSLVKFSDDQPNRNFYTMLDESNKVDIPGLIIEHAFLSNYDDAAFIENRDNQNRVGAADATAIAEYFGLKKRTVSEDFITLTRTYSARIKGDGNTGFSSSDENIAYVSDSGLITAIGAGTTEIKYKDADGNKHSLTVEVPEVKLVAITAGLNPTFFESEEALKNFNRSHVMVKRVYSDGSVKQLTEGYSIGDPIAQGNGLYFIPIEYKGYQCNLRLYLDDYLSHVGNYAEYDYEIVGSNQDILLIPESFEGGKDTPAVVEPTIEPTQPSQAPETEAPTTDAPQTEPAMESETEAAATNDNPDPENKQTESSQSSSELLPSDTTMETTTSDADAESKSTADDTSKTSSLTPEATSLSESGTEASTEVLQKNWTWLYIALGVIGVALIALIILIVVRNRMNHQ